MSRVPPQTTKQAKAAHKARGTATLSDTKLRQLERESLLQRRAWAAKEREKTNHSAAQKRAEKLEQERAELSDTSRFATQRRVDRYGHKSSQFHLGAFFKHAAPVKAPLDDKDDFDADMDDSVLLSLVETPNPKSCLQMPFEKTSPLADPGQHIDNGDWSDFESSTQIAKDLNGGVTPRTARSRTASQPRLVCPRTQTEARLSNPDERSKRIQSTMRSLGMFKSQSQAQVAQLDGSVDNFSQSQLENFLDDELVLTQA